VKTAFIFSVMFLFAWVFSPTALADAKQERVARADKYYQLGEFKKARDIYLKLAKIGDYYSQYRVSQMFASGQGTRTDLVEAYAWAALATEGGEEEVEKYRDDLLLRVADKTEAREQAESLMEKYGKDALQEKAESKARREQSRNSPTCTGSRLPC